MRMKGQQRLYHQPIEYLSFFFDGFAKNLNKMFSAYVKYIMVP